jgi:hypothetical protein
MRQNPPAEAIAKEFGMRRTRPANRHTMPKIHAFDPRRALRCWRGDCPKCGTDDAFIVSTGKTGAARAYCRACDEGATIHPQTTQTQGA